jgi:hypothetical protein
MTLSNLPPGCHPDDIDGGLHPTFYCSECGDPCLEDDEGLCPACQQYEEDDEDL